MDLYKLLILQFIAHVLSDYFLQFPKWSVNKDLNGFRSGYLYKHIMITFFFSAILSFSFSFIIFSAIIAAIHLLIDGLKKVFFKINYIKEILFFVDQLLHISVIISIVLLYDKYFTINFFFELPDLKYLIYVFAYLLMLKPANILIREIFKSYNIKLDNSDYIGEELPNAGKLIGIIERILTLTLIFLNQFAAIGFILAAKSILRFKEAQAKKAEYVLIGTMLSFGIAIIFGIIIKYFFTGL